MNFLENMINIIHYGLKKTKLYMIVSFVIYNQLIFNLNINFFIINLGSNR